MKQKASCIWHLNRNCNFNCSYCYLRNLKKDEPGHGVKRDIEAFKSNNIKWQTITMSGGEPFIYPDFITLCKKLTSFSNIVIETNCSTSNIFDFADTIYPRKVVEVSCSLHLGERRKKDFPLLIERIRYLRDRGFSVYLSQVVHPLLFNEYKVMFSEFQKEGIYIAPKVFEGIYRLKEYPLGYSRKMKQEILKYISLVELDYFNELPSNNHMHKYGSMINGSIGWCGETCSAGFNNMQIQYNGNTYRCHGDKQYLGNLYDGSISPYNKPVVCNKTICNCALEGWCGHSFDGVPNIKRSIKKIGKEYAVSILGKVKK